MDTDKDKVAGRVTPCAPGRRLQPDGAHGVTRPTNQIEFAHLGKSHRQLQMNTDKIRRPKFEIQMAERQKNACGDLRLAAFVCGGSGIATA
jgi:hypothetical protein